MRPLCSTKDCNAVASFGFSGGEAVACYQHKNDDMVDWLTLMADKASNRTGGTVSEKKNGSSSESSQKKEKKAPSSTAKSVSPVPHHDEDVSGDGGGSSSSAKKESEKEKEKETPASKPTVAPRSRSPSPPPPISHTVDDIDDMDDSEEQRAVESETRQPAPPATKEKDVEKAKERFAESYETLIGTPSQPPAPISTSNGGEREREKEREVAVSQTPKVNFAEGSVPAKSTRGNSNPKPKPEKKPAAKSPRSPRHEGPFCEKESCLRKAVYNYSGLHAAFCINHYTRGMVAVGWQCKEDGCPKVKLFGYPNQGRMYCREHHKPGMEYLHPMKCQDCNKTASYGEQGGKFMYCSDHARIGMVSRNGKVKDETQASFKPLNEKKREREQVIPVEHNSFEGGRRVRKVPSRYDE